MLHGRGVMEVVCGVWGILFFWRFPPKARQPLMSCRSPPQRRRSDSAPLNSAPISTRPATDFHVGISTPEFRPDDATLKYDVTLRQLSLSSCPNPSRAISCSSSLVLLFPLCLDRRSSSLLKFVSRGVGILLGWWRLFNRVGWEYRQPLR